MAQTFPDGAQSLAFRDPTQGGMQNSGTIATPPQQDFNTPAMEGSMQQFLADNRGEYVVVEFLIGTQATVKKAGILYAVGTSVMTLYNEYDQTYVMCDIFSVKFVTFYLPGRRPWMVPGPAAGMGGPGMTPGGGMMGSGGMGSMGGSMPGMSGGADMGAMDGGMAEGDRFPGGMGGNPRMGW